MSPPLLVVVTGEAATGKTTLARALAAELGLPLLAKDDLKERLFDTLGTGDREWSRRLGVATFELLFGVADGLLGAGTSCVVEANFDAQAVPRLRALSGHRTFQIVCTAPEEVARERFAARAASGERHPGHLDGVIAEELAAGEHDGRWGPLDLDGELLVVDTAEPVDVPWLAAAALAAA